MSDKHQLEFFTIGGRWRLELCTFVHNRTRWLLAYRCNGDSLLHFWCSNYDPKTTAREFCDRLSLASEGVLNESELLDTFVGMDDRWLYWGGGMPMPISEFYATEISPHIPSASDH